MKKIMTACFVLWHIFSWASVPSPSMWVSLPVDNRVWFPLYSSLPFEQDALWLAPESESSPVDRKEFLIIKKGPKGSTLNEMTLGIGLAKTEDVFAQKFTSGGGIALAINDAKAGQFTIVRIFQGPDAVYEIRYVAPEKFLSEGEKETWWLKINEATADRSFNNPLWLSVRANGVFRNKKPLKSLDKWTTYHHQTLPFSVELPQTWVFGETSWEQKRVDEGQPGFTSFLTFTRMDNLMFGSVSISDHPLVESQAEVEREWNAAIQSSRRMRGPNSIIAHGNFRKNKGGYNKYVITREPNSDQVCWKVFQTQKCHTYKIEVYVDEANLSECREELLKILSGLTVD